MHLAAGDVDAVRLAVDDAHVEVRIVLLAGAAAAVALGVGDRLRAADIGRPCTVDELVDPLAVIRVHLAEGRATSASAMQAAVVPAVMSLFDIAASRMSMSSCDFGMRYIGWKARGSAS